MTESVPQQFAQFAPKRFDPKAAPAPVHCKNGVVWVSSPALDRLPWLANGTSTRIGGVSTGHTASMNFCLNEFDTAENVARNREAFFEAVEIDPESVVNSRQVHKTDIAVVDEAMMAMPPEQRAAFNGDIDGLTTDVAGATLACYSADCCIVTVADPANRAVGIVHAGWRGTVGKIAAKLLDVMAERYGTDPGDVVCSIAPSICPDCFEVGADVVEAAREAFDERACQAVFAAHDNGDGKYQFDLWEANAQVLMGAGVPREGIEKPNLCTCCNPDLFFSHRASHGKRGTIMTFVGIR